MANPIIDYSATIISPGFDLRIEGEHTPNVTAIYDDNSPSLGIIANCRVNIQYSNIQWVVNNDNSVTVTGTIDSATLVRQRVYQGSTALDWKVWTEIDGQRTFSAIVHGGTPGTYNLNPPSTFSVTVPPQTSKATVASIHFFNQWVEGVYAPDEFTVGIIITNPNLPDYRPGAIRDNDGVWQSHNRSGGEVHILTGDGNWKEERTMGAPTEKGNPPSIRKNNAWFNGRKIGKE